MKLNLDTFAKDVEGNSLTKGEPGKEVPCTWGYIIIRSLGNVVPGTSISDDVVYKRYQIQKRIRVGGTQDFSIEELSEMKTAIKQAIPSPSQRGPALDFVEGLSGEEK